jgi:hypothetical protein
VTYDECIIQAHSIDARQSITVPSDEDVDEPLALCAKDFNNNIAAIDRLRRHHNPLHGVMEPDHHEGVQWLTVVVAQKN